MDEVKFIQLSGGSFSRQVVEHGFFPEQIPACFTSKKLTDKLDDILLIVGCNKKQREKKSNITAPELLSTYKNGVSRRILSIPNPEAFLRLVKFMSNNWDAIVEFAESPNSLSPITYLHSYKEIDSCWTEIEEINSENIRDAHKSKSDYVDGIKKSIILSAGYQYRLKLDIANCYNSLYTHSIAWAICGKEIAKTFLRTKKPERIKGDYELADALDVLIRYQKNKETNGIVVGPFTSRIFSEIVLAGIDRELAKEGYVFKRYVDDYKFYFRTETEARLAVQKIEKILSEYNLSINLSKLQVEKFPYEIISDMRAVYEKALENDGVFGVLNAAAKLHSEGEKGAYKYALKYIKNRKLPQDGFETIFPILVNVMLLDPKYGKYVIDFLRKNKKKIDKESLSEIANKELEISIKNGLQQEALVFLYMIHELRLALNGENVVRVFESDNDLAIIIALDIWVHHNKLVVRNRTEARTINDSMQKLANELEDEKYDKERWLLLYEVEQHGLFKKCKYTPPIMPDFFKKLVSENISFYE